MALYYAIRSAPALNITAGDTLNDAINDVATYLRYGGQVWAQSDAIVATAAKIAQNARARGDGGPALDTIMLAAVAKSQQAAIAALQSLTTFAGTIGG